jgi:hypothetical protein
MKKGGSHSTATYIWTHHAILFPTGAITACLSTVSGQIVNVSYILVTLSFAPVSRKGIVSSLVTLLFSSKISPTTVSVIYFFTPALSR